MNAQRNRGMYVFLGICFLLLLAVISIIIILNRPSALSQEALISPTPVSQTAQSKSPRVTPVTVVGESGFTPEEARNYLQVRKEADQAFADRKRRMPFITKLPYITSRYKIEISAESDTITITTVGPASFQKAYQEEARNWLRLNGGNPETLQIRYDN